MRTLVLGAAGATGRHLVDLALAAGHDVTAVVRRPPEPGVNPAARLVVVDATDPDTVASTVADHDAVLSSLGARPTRGPDHGLLRSDGCGRLRDAPPRRVPPDRGQLQRARPDLASQRGVVVQHRARPAGQPPRRPHPPRRHAPHGGLAHQHRGRPRLDRHPPRGPVRPPHPTGYQVAPGQADGLYTARIDLAAAMVAELTDRRFVHQAMGVITTDVRPTLTDPIRHEVLGRAS